MFLPMTGAFLQSKEWEAFQQAAGARTWRVEGVLVIARALRFGFSYLYAPRPRSMGQEFFLRIGELARRERAVFLKIDPREELPAVREPTHTSRALQPRETTIVDLNKSEQELLGDMHEKTRYNIRLAERRGVSAATGTFDMFWKLLTQTTERDGFYAHPKEYYDKLLEVRSDDFSNELFFAEYNGVVVAAALINFYQGTATYLHGASSNEHRNVMAPHALHWRIMQEAKARGCTHYDFWGTDAKRWPGLTRFKQGFGGTMSECPLSVDVAYRPFWYHLYALTRGLRG